MIATYDHGMDPSPTAVGAQATTAPAPPSGCPVHQPAASDTPAGGCPVHAAPTTSSRRGRADVFVRRLLRIPALPVGASMVSAHRAFQRSMAISATRCTLTYIVFPFALPAIGFATGVGPVVGLTIGILAITCDVFAVRRFFAIDHKWRWQVLAVVTCVIGLLTVLMAQDVANLAA